ncbi:protein yippee-like 4 isoform X1 [Serinus canaria]|nr:protein yippee-like 4 isoform X1 [Serinus canaria]
MLLTLPRPPPTATSLSSFTATANIPPSTLPPPGDPRTPPGTPNLPLGTPIIAPWNLITAVRTPTNSRRESHHPSPGSPLPPLGTRSFPPQDPHHLPGDPPTPQGLPHASRSDPRTSLGRPPSPVPRAPRAVPAVPVSPLSRCHSCNEPPALSRLRWRSAQTWEAEEGSPPYRPLPPSQAAPLFRLLLPGAPGGAPRARPGGTAALGALLRCFPCERLCGGCGVPPGALPPAMPPPGRRRLPPAARLPPRTFRSYLPRSHRTYSCVHCRAHLARHEELISKVPPPPPGWVGTVPRLLRQRESPSPRPRGGPRTAGVPSPCPQSAEFLPTVPQVSPCGVLRVVSAPPVVSREEDVPTVASIAPRQEASYPPWRGVLAVAGDPYGAPTEVTVLPSVSPSWQVSPCGVPRPVAVQRDGSRTWREGCRGRGAPPVTLAVSPQSFQGSHGRAYLFNSVVNVGCGPAEQRLLLTGLHSVADIFCQSCNTTLGWKYEQAFESSQKYKEGKFIIEMSHMVKENGWD